MRAWQSHKESHSLIRSETGCLACRMQKYIIMNLYSQLVPSRGEVPTPEHTDERSPPGQPPPAPCAGLTACAAGARLRGARRVPRRPGGALRLCQQRGLQRLGDLRTHTGLHRVRTALASQPHPNCCYRASGLFQWTYPYLSDSDNHVPLHTHWEKCQLNTNKMVQVFNCDCCPLIEHEFSCLKTRSSHLLPPWFQGIMTVSLGALLMHNG